MTEENPTKANAQKQAGKMKLPNNINKKKED